MRVLWVVNHYMPDLAKKLDLSSPISGSWLVEASKALSEKHELIIVCPSKQESGRIKIGKITYYTIKMSFVDKFISPTKFLIKETKCLLEEIKPDIIHIHGSEFAFSLAFLQEKNIPVIMSIQGLISQIIKNGYNWAGINDKYFFQYLTPNNIMIYAPLVLKNIRDFFRAQAEIKQFELCQYRIGRTSWDECQTFYYNPNSTYFFLQEQIRKPFYMLQHLEKKTTLNMMN